ncbi:S8 family peptidase [Aquimarina aquimarini]|uniref:S8 family peptidase n=1 Tax=Aquimarina aquimarini TaxID=1191734 RepID=UPI001F29BF14|nr:S8/S53 family peptidase [Aquimarina aquimarini]
MNHLKLKKRGLIFGALLTTTLVVTTSCNKDEDEPIEDFQQTDHEQNLIPKEYIVLFNDATIKSKAVAEESIFILEKYGITEAQIAEEYTTIFKGVFLKGIPKEIAEQLKNDPGVKSVTQNMTFDFEPALLSQSTKFSNETYSQKTNVFNNITKPSGEVLPWGPQRIGYGDGTGKKIWIIDTGIAEIDELNIDKKNSRNFVSDKLLANGKIDPTAWQDTHATSHGTRVASIAAAKENNKGIIGVAAGATVVSIRASGGGLSLADMESVFDYIASRIQPGEVWNFSGGPLYSRDELKTIFKVPEEQLVLFENAIIALAQIAPGFLAAGNATDNLDMDPWVDSHLSTQNDKLYVIGAINNQHQQWESSNYGSVIDYWAPGVDVVGVNKMGKVQNDSGTSMAAPMVAAMYVLRDGDLNIRETYTDTGKNTRPIPHIIIPAR